MKSPIFALSAFALALAIPHSLAQTTALENSAFNTEPTPMHANNYPSAAAFVSRPPVPRAATPSYHPFSAIGFATRVGLGGTGFDVATPLAMRFNLRAGGDFFNYATTLH
ncbi:hypothetical protein [Tunturiibacter psychrotolerans]|uniref:hypothetical protein n=1 Tax=Tunturiibacter psychrotolerans TaxID=3069686 RepID=UPI003D1ED01B